jgi:aspartate/methionine/tyrosine aminotransferase
MRPQLGRAEGVREAPIVELISNSNVPSDVVDLGQGVPFYGPPRGAILAGADALGRASGFKYSPDAGLSTFREAIGEKLASENKIEADSNNNIMVTPGANEAFMNAILCTTKPGDHVMVLSPYYFNHVMAIELAGCKPTVIETDDNYLPNIERINQSLTRRVKAIVLVTPNNPTGAVYSRRAIEEISAICAENGIYLISDETYEHFVYDGAQHISALELDKDIEHTISLFSFSKSYGMSGYRIGYAVFPKHIYNEMLKVQDTIAICAPSPLQTAAEAALKIGPAYPRQFIPRIENVRNIFVERLAGFDLAQMPVTKGGYYFLLKLKTKKSDRSIAKRLIEEHGVITIPGEVFGTEYPALRVAYANVDDRLAEKGILRLTKGLTAVL